MNTEKDQQHQEQEIFYVSGKVPTTLDFFIGNLLRNAALLPVIDALVFETDLKRILVEVGLGASMYLAGTLHRNYINEKYNLK